MTYYKFVVIKLNSIYLDKQHFNNILISLRVCKYEE